MCLTSFLHSFSGHLDLRPIDLALNLDLTLHRATSCGFRQKKGAIRTLIVPIWSCGTEKKDRNWMASCGKKKRLRWMEKMYAVLIMIIPLVERWQRCSKLHKTGILRNASNFEKASEWQANQTSRKLQALYTWSLKLEEAFSDLLIGALMGQAISVLEMGDWQLATASVGFRREHRAIPFRELAGESTDRRTSLRRRGA